MTCKFAISIPSAEMARRKAFKVRRLIRRKPNPERRHLKSSTRNDPYGKLWLNEISYQIRSAYTQGAYTCRVMLTNIREMMDPDHRKRLFDGIVAILEDLGYIVRMEEEVLAVNITFGRIPNSSVAISNGMVSPFRVVV